MRTHVLLTTGFVLTWVAMVTSGVDVIADFAVVNGALQVTLFALVVCLPLWRTDRMSFVDIGWPWGLVLIGAQVLLQAPGEPVRAWLVGGMYLFVGLRMGVGALVLAVTTGEIFRTELPRYRYRHEMLALEGARHPRLRRQHEALNQGLANASILSVPAVLVLASGEEALSPVAIVGIAVWVAGYVIENIADGQKHLFVREHPGELCDVGLWRYSRHPNYFGEWVVWCGLALTALPSLFAISDDVSALTWWLLLAGLLGAPAALYTTLVHLTGAKPAEHYSVQKRPGYAAYQRTTSVLIPMPPRPDPLGERPATR